MGLGHSGSDPGQPVDSAADPAAWLAIRAARADRAAGAATAAANDCAESSIADSIDAAIAGAAALHVAAADLADAAADFRLAADLLRSRSRLSRRR